MSLHYYEMTTVSSHRIQALASKMAGKAAFKSCYHHFFLLGNNSSITSTPLLCPSIWMKQHWKRTGIKKIKVQKC